MLTRKLSLLLLAIFCSNVLIAENLSSFSIQPAYLQNGKVKLNQVGTTNIKFDVQFVRYLAQGTTNYENANINFRLVAFHPSSSNGTPVIGAYLSPAYSFTNADFTAQSPNYVNKTYTIDVNYSTMSSETYIALIWTSNAYPGNVPPSNSFNLSGNLYQYITVAPVIPITNNTIAFGTPYQYMENLNISGSTPTVSSGGYSYEWLITTFSFPNTNTLTSLTASILSGPEMLNQGNINIQRKVTNPSGAVSLSNTLTMVKPTTNAVVTIDELPGNQKVGDRFVLNTAFGLTVHNPVPGIKYVWYYYHHWGPSNAQYTLSNTNIGPTFSFMLGTTKFPPPPSTATSLPEWIYVYGSDGTFASFPFQLTQ